jgi:hypothetical protein
MATGTLIYHWTSAAKALTAIKSGRLQARRWEHFIEGENRFARGTSWSLDPEQWRRDNEVCLVVSKDAVPNAIHAVNGNRTFWLTKGMTDSNYDPQAYKHEPTEPDEEFVEGAIEDLGKCLVAIYVEDTVGSVAVIEQVTGKGIRLLNRPPANEGDRPPQP